MRHVRREVDEITRPDFRSKFEPLSPAYFAAAFNDIDSNFVATMVMRTSVRSRLEGNSPDPRLLSAGTGEIKCGSTSFS